MNFALDEKKWNTVKALLTLDGRGWKGDCLEASRRGLLLEEDTEEVIILNFVQFTSYCSSYRNARWLFYHILATCSSLQ